MLLVALQPVRLRQFSNAAAIVCESRQTQEDSINISDGAMPIVRILSVVWVFSFCCVSFADQIVLTNGDRLTGTIMKADDKTLVIKTEFAGDVTVQWPAVQEIHSTQDLAPSYARGKDARRHGYDCGWQSCGGHDNEWNRDCCKSRRDCTAQR